MHFRPIGWIFFNQSSDIIINFYLNSGSIYEAVINLGKYASENMLGMNMKEDRILLDHGSGGKISHHLISDMVLPLFQNPILNRLDDGAVFQVGDKFLAFSTDSYVVDPVFFPGGSIGDLAVNGTVNDISMCGAAPLYISLALMIEEGFPIYDLKRILDDVKTAAEKAGVSVITGDTKVVPKGAMDKIFINTAGVGELYNGFQVSGRNAKPGDKIILSGMMADHGVTILAAREGLNLTTSVKTDSAPLNHMVGGLFRSGVEVHVLRDPTRGGVGTTLNEIALSAGVGIRIHEKRLPVRKEVLGVCELLGLDPLYLANEGKLLAFVAEKDVEMALAIIRNDPFGKDAAVIGEAVSDHPGKVVMETPIGGTRIVDMLTGDQLPRIC